MSPLAHSSKRYAVQDCKIAKMTADPSGGAATYGTSVDVPGIKTVDLSVGLNTNELRGDNGPLDQTSTLGQITGSVSHAKISLDVLGVILGPTVTDSGTTPSQTAVLALVGGATPSTPGYFRLEAVTPSNGSDLVGGDVFISLKKCIVTGVSDLGFAEEDYAIASFDFAAIPTLATGNKIFEISLRETTAALT